MPRPLASTANVRRIAGTRGPAIRGGRHDDGGDAATRRPGVGGGAGDDGLLAGRLAGASRRRPPRSAVPRRDRPHPHDRPGDVRPARRRPLHAAVPERPLHRGRRRHRHGPAGRTWRRRRRPPTCRACTSIRPSSTATTGSRPGRPIALLLPGVDPEASGLAPITDIGASLDRDAPIAIVDADTGERHPYWAELDVRAPDPAHQLLFLRPARNFLEGHRYIVAVRDVVDAAGQPIAPTDVFRAYRDRLRSDVPAVEDRRPHMDDLFRTLQRRGHVRQRDLTLAWDFTVASGENLSERLLAMRDDAFATLGDAAPGIRRHERHAEHAGQPGDRGAGHVPGPELPDRHRWARHRAEQRRRAGVVAAARAHRRVHGPLHLHDPAVGDRRRRLGGSDAR